MALVNQNSTEYSLDTLDLSHNNITSLNPNQFASLHNLTVIRLHHNYIETIEADIFRYNLKLSTIVLSYNNINSFKFNVSNLDNLTLLDMSNNGMTSLDETIFSTYLLRGQYLMIFNNSFSCDCSMNWITKLNLNASSVLTKPNPKCSHDPKANISVYCFMNFEDSTDNCPILQSTICNTG